MNVRPDTGEHPGPDGETIYPLQTTTTPDPTATTGGTPTPRPPHAQATRTTRAKATDAATLRQSLAEHHAADLAHAALAMARAFAAGARLYAFGNGAGATDAQQIVTTLLRPRVGRPLPALALTCDAAALTALSQDVGDEAVFARRIAAEARPGDIALGLSTGGGAPNIVRALDQASRLGLLTIALIGDRGDRLADLDIVDHLFVVPSPSLHRVQEAHATLYHALGELTQRALDALEARER